MKITETNGHTNGLKIEVKNIKHDFTGEERDQIGGELARAIGTLRGITGDFDQVKAGFKAKITAAEAQIDNLSTARMNGFEMRNERCVVVYRPEKREKDYFREVELEHLPGGSSDLPRCIERSLIEPVLTEPMTPDDFQAELIQAEEKFELREEIELFQPTETDRGHLIVGKFAGKWFSALRVKIGKVQLTERLDSEQRSFKQRSDAVGLGVKRVTQWAKDNFKEHAKGFEQKFQDVILAHAERAE